MVRVVGAKQKDSIGVLLFPSSKREELMRRGVKPKDYMRDNRLELKESQQKQRQIKLEAEQAPPPLFKMTQFKDIPSRLYDEKKPTATPTSSPSPEGKEKGKGGLFLERRQSEKRIEELAHSKRVQRSEFERKIERERSESGRPPTPRKASVPSSTDVARLPPKKEINFIGKNRTMAQVQGPLRRLSLKEDSETPSKHESYGRVPDYLEQRNQQWAEAKEEERRNAPDPHAPPGMALMSEEERKSTLDKLFSSQAAVLQQLSLMPFVIETQSQKNCQHALELKLNDIENAVKIFSKPKVYIAV